MCMYFQRLIGNKLTPGASVGSSSKGGCC
jgi:hypothetical protein